MARPPEIADDAIIAAGRSLAAENLRITGFALRKRLGAGAPNRLLRIWEKHVAEEVAAAAPEEPGLPVEEPLAEILARFGRQTESLAGDIVALVTGVARQAGIEDQRRLQADLQHREAELAEAEDLIGQQDATIAGLRESLDGAAGRIGGLEDALRAVTAERDAAVRRTAALEAELAGRTAEMQEARAEGDRAGGRVQILERANAALEQRLMVLEGRCDELQREILAARSAEGQANGRLDSAQAAHARSEAMIRTLYTEMQEQRGQLGAAQAHVENLRTEAARLAQDRERLHGELAAERARLAEMAAAVAALALPPVAPPAAPPAGDG